MTRKEFFNSCACSWDNKKNPLDIYKIKKFILPLLNFKADDILLDIACGTGIFVQALKEENKNVKITGIDFAQNMITKAIKKFPEIDFIAADVEKMPFSDNSFDKVICLNAFPHFENKNKAIREIARVLKKNGLFILAHTDSKRNIDAYHRKAGGVIAEDLMPDNEVLTKILDENGFKRIKLIDNDEVFIIKASK